MVELESELRKMTEVRLEAQCQKIRETVIRQVDAALSELREGTRRYLSTNRVTYLSDL